MTRRPLAVWRALRAYLEGARASIELAADLSGYAPKTIASRAEREGWRIDRLPEEGLSDKLRVVTAMLVERVEALGRKALEEGTKIEKAEIDGLTTMIKGLGTLFDITRTEETAINNQIRRDEDLADVLTRINERIVTLATELAGKMVSEQCRPVGS